MIITGAPVETLAYEEVDYWDELCQIFDWGKSHVYSTLHLCWGAQAGLYYKYGIKKVLLEEKLSGIFSQNVKQPSNPIVRGFDDCFMAPHSRYTEVRHEDVTKVDRLEVIAEGPTVGLSIVASKICARFIALDIWNTTVKLWISSTSVMLKLARILMCLHIIMSTMILSKTFR